MTHHDDPPETTTAEAVAAAWAKVDRLTEIRDAQTAVADWQVAYFAAQDARKEAERLDALHRRQEAERPLRERIAALEQRLADRTDSASLAANQGVLAVLLKDSDHELLTYDADDMHHYATYRRRGFDPIFTVSGNTFMLLFAVLRCNLMAAEIAQATLRRGELERQVRDLEIDVHNLATTWQSARVDMARHTDKLSLLWELVTRHEDAIAPAVYRALLAVFRPEHPKEEEHATASLPAPSH